MFKKTLTHILICSILSLSVFAQDQSSTEANTNKTSTSKPEIDKTYIVEPYIDDCPFGEIPFGYPRIKIVSKKANLINSHSITLEYFSLDLKESAKMMRLNLSDTECYKYLSEKAEIEELTILKTSVEKVSTESISEHIYPTEYAPMEDTVNLSPVKIIPVTPAAFETRNTGLDPFSKESSFIRCVYYIQS